MDEKAKKGNLHNQRMKSRICEFVSYNRKVIDCDNENYNDIEMLEKIDINQEVYTKEKTKFISYAEIKVCSKISTTNWDDSFNIRWELLVEFFMKFDLEWSPINFLKRR